MVASIKHLVVHVCAALRPALCVVLIGAACAGCATRALHPDAAAIEVNPPPERIVHRLIASWESELARYIDEQGGGDPGVLAQTRIMHARDGLRPARITFDVLDVESQVSSRDGWDVEGVLVGKYPSGTRSWYVFVVGIIARAGYRPSSIQDVRAVAVSARGRQLSWIVSQADPGAVARYRQTFSTSARIRFPAELDQFVMDATAGRLSIREVRSDTQWTLQVGDEPAEVPATEAGAGVFIRAGSTP